MNRGAILAIVALSMGLGWSWTGRTVARQDPCHRLRSCPSDGHTYVCGDRGRCDQCPDNQY